LPMEEAFCCAVELMGWREEGEATQCCCLTLLLQVEWNAI
jgi:hypothetical protein